MQATIQSRHKYISSKRLKQFGGMLSLSTPMLVSALEIVAPVTNPIFGNPLHLESPLMLQGKTRLEDDAHLSKALQALWQKPECEEFLTNLLEDNRGGKRAGFPQQVAEDIVLLKTILRMNSRIDFPSISGAEEKVKDPSRAESLAWRKVRMIP